MNFPAPNKSCGKIGSSNAELHHAARHGPPWRNILWLSCGVVLAALMVGLAVFGRETEGSSGLDPSRWPIASLCALSGVIYLIAAALTPRASSGRRWLLFIVLVGVAMRVPLWLAPVTRGDDFERYLWDGAVTATGENPYRYSPRQIIAGKVDEDGSALLSLSVEGRDVLGRINHPDLRTIYPPVAQGLFAVAYWLGPLRIAGWRIVLACLDVLTAFLVILLLRDAGLPRLYLSIYMWNPLVVFETYNRLHLDLALGPFLLLTVWALVHRRAVVAGLALAGAAGIKLWPILLLGFLIRGFLGDWRRLALGLGVFAGAVVLMGVFFSTAFGGNDSGVAAYVTRWDGGEGAYAIFNRAGLWLKDNLALSCDGKLVARGMMMVALAGVVGWLGFRRFNTPVDLCRRMALAGLMMLLLSPVLWPWYFVAIIPLAAISPRPSLLVWTALLWLVYPLRALPDKSLILTAIIHVPVWALLCIEAALAIRRARSGKVRVNV